MARANIGGQTAPALPPVLAGKFSFDGTIDVSPTAVAAKDLVLALRGERAARPRVDPTLAGGLRAWLEDDLALSVADVAPSAPLFLSPRTIIDGASQGSTPTLALARGALVGALVAQRCHG